MGGASAVPLMSADSIDVTTEAPLLGPGVSLERRVDVEDVVIRIAADAGASMNLAFWEELRVACQYDGVTQRTRWMALPLAVEEARRKWREAPSGDGGEGDSSIDLAYSSFNNMSYAVQFTAEDAGHSLSGSSESRSPGADPSLVRTVKPKKIHQFEFVVEAQNKQRVFSASGGLTGDVAPTSGNMEAISAVCNKGVAKMSAWKKSVFSKLGGSLNSKEDPKRKSAAAHLDNSAEIKGDAPPAPDGVVEGSYTTVVQSIDVSEAYNAPGGKKRFSMEVVPTSNKTPGVGAGTPLSIAFTVAVHYGETKAAERSFYDFVILADQFVLDLSNAEKALPLSKDDSSVVKPITAYAFGYSSNTAPNANAVKAMSRVVPVTEIFHSGMPEGEGAVRLIDFDRLQTQSDEHLRTLEDYKALPTSCCIVSGPHGLSPLYRPLLGHRVVCVSRFKTSTDGLCKPSFKCQLAVSLKRYSDASVAGKSGAPHEMEEEVAAPINLAALLNQEYLPQRVRTLRFSLGEVMYLRLRRACFVHPEKYGAPLVGPFDYCSDAPPPRPAEPNPPVPSTVSNPPAAAVESSDDESPPSVPQEQTPTAPTATSSSASSFHGEVEESHDPPAAVEQRSVHADVADLASAWGRAAGGDGVSPAFEFTAATPNPFFSEAATTDGGADAATTTATPGKEEAVPNDSDTFIWDEIHGADGAQAPAAFEITPLA